MILFVIVWELSTTIIKFLIVYSIEYIKELFIQELISDNLVNE